jgi:hypothetical protein
VFRDVEVQDPPAIVADHEKAIEYAEYALRGEVWPVHKTNTPLGGYAPLISWRGARPAQQNGPRFAFRLCPPLMIY